MDVVEKKEIVHEYDQLDHAPYYGRYGWNYREPASKGVAGAGLGLIYQALIIVILYETLP